MKGPAIDQLVYAYIFPKPRSTDPPNFQSLLQRQLVPEVRLETQAFYGHLSSQEAKYPGLDYSYKPHRARLSRYPWHRRLFRAFDNLGLTESEIACLTKWEGTRWAKERFEREQGIVIRDTTADGITDWVEPELRSTVITASYDKQEHDKLEKVLDESLPGRLESEGAEETEDDRIVDRDRELHLNEEVDEESDIEIQSVGLALNERLRAVVAQREAGNVATVMDEEWEQWFKEAVEAGGLPLLSTHISRNHTHSTRPESGSHISSTSTRLRNASRLESWNRTPDSMQSILRQNTDTSTFVPPSSNGWPHRRTGEYLGYLRQLSSSSSNRGSTTNSSPAHRSNNISPSRRSTLSPAEEMDSRMRQWDNQRILLRSSASGSRLSHFSAIRSTQNRNGNGSIS
ncbi:hypothetical protein GcM1_222044 [Golovinomyces cichoracearum]|uniref:Nitrogen permease regulator 2 like protein n=1 Tax=Golovinomyces cichoracearum TaxID=62708 RepID=A0A420IRG2_9PEZI|nr:hypothetical protein GcM1_222044 [Golovinomyces cichoracearum]